MKDQIKITKEGTKYFLGNKEVSEEEYRESYPEIPVEQRDDCEVGTETDWRKPIHSHGAGVHPADRQKAEDNAKAHGVPTEFDGHGRPVFRSRRHQKAYLRAIGMHNNDDF